MLLAKWALDKRKDLFEEVFGPLVVEEPHSLRGSSPSPHADPQCSSKLFPGSVGSSFVCHNGFTGFASNGQLLRQLQGPEVILRKGRPCGPFIPAFQGTILAEYGAFWTIWRLKPDNPNKVKDAPRP